MRHKGTADFIALRASSVLLLPFVVWALYSAVDLAGADYETVRAWASRPLNAVPMALFIAISAFHMRTGAAEILTDYVHPGGVFRILNTLACIFAAGAAVYGAIALAF
ncbi:MAG: succinate dehydrogenase, hydrophobic membrane anchor protein [Parvularculaceae bacterium]